jgi:hypothetical protein
MEIPLVSALKLAVQVTVAPSTSAGALIPRAESRISSLPTTGTVVTQCPPLNVVVAHVALGLKRIVPSGTM